MPKKRGEVDQDEQIRHLMVRVPRRLHIALRHAAIDEEVPVTVIVVRALERELGTRNGHAAASR